MSRMDFARTILGAHVDAQLRDRFLNRYAERLSCSDVWYSEPRGVEGFKFLLIVKSPCHDKNLESDALHAKFSFGYVTLRGEIGQSILRLPADLSCADAQYAEFISEPARAHSPYMHLFHGSSWARGYAEREMDAVFSAAVEEPLVWDEADYVNYAEYFLPHRILARIAGTAKSGAKRKMGGALAAFRQHVPGEVLNVANKLTRLDLESIIWLSGQGNTAVSRSRCQAATAFPLLFDVLRTDLEVSHAIDVQSLLLPVLSRRTGISQAVLRRMQGKTWRFGTGSPNKLPLSPFIGLDPNDFPKNRREMREHVEFSHMRCVLAGGEWEPGMLNSSVIPGRPNDMRMIRDGGGAGLVSDALREVVTHILFPKYAEMHTIDTDTCEGNHEHVVAMQTALYRSLGVRGALKLSRSWHENIVRLDAMKWSGDEEQTGWRPIMGEGQTENGLSYEEITSENDLFALGKDQKHCIFSYIDNILYPRKGKDYGFVFRCHRDGKTLNTVYYETRIQEHRIKVDLIEERARQNDDPQEDAVIAAEWVRRKLEKRLNEKGVLEGYADAIEEYSLIREKNSFQVSSAFISELSLLLPKSLREDAGLHRICRAAHEIFLSKLLVPETGRI